MSQAEDGIMQALAARYREWGGGPVEKSGAPSSPWLSGDELMAATGLDAQDAERACAALIQRGLIKNEISNGFIAGLTDVGKRHLGL